MKWFNLVVVALALLACILASLVVASSAFADGPKGDTSPQTSCPNVMQGKGGSGPVDAAQSTERNGGKGKQEYNGPPELVLVCHPHLGEVYRPSPAAANMVEHGAVYGPCPSDPTIIVTPTVVVTPTTPVVYRVYLPFVANGYGESSPELDEPMPTATLVRTTITRTTITRTVIERTIRRTVQVNTVYKTITTTSIPSGGGNDWVLVLVVILPIMALPIIKKGRLTDDQRKSLGICLQGVVRNIRYRHGLLVWLWLKRCYWVIVDPAKPLPMAEWQAAWDKVYPMGSPDPGSLAK